MTIILACHCREARAPPSLHRLHPATPLHLTRPTRPPAMVATVLACSFAAAPCFSSRVTPSSSVARTCSFVPALVKPWRPVPRLCLKQKLRRVTSSFRPPPSPPRRSFTATTPSPPHHPSPSNPPTVSRKPLPRAPCPRAPTDSGATPSRGARSLLHRCLAAPPLTVVCPP